MHLTILNIIAALVAGGALGATFGLLQNAALRRNEKRERSGTYAPGMGAMAGSFRRVAYLLIALVAIQWFCPLLFADGCQWWVSGGLVAGYGSLLFLELRRRLARARQSS